MIISTIVFIFIFAPNLLDNTFHNYLYLFIIDLDINLIMNPCITDIHYFLIRKSSLTLINCLYNL